MVIPIIEYVIGGLLQNFGERITNHHLKRKGYALIKEISKGNFSRVLIARKNKGKRVVLKFPNPILVRITPNVEFSRGVVNFDLTSRVKHIQDEVKVLDKLKGADGIAQNLDYFEIPFSSVYSIDSLLRYDPTHFGEFGMYADFFAHRKIPVIVNEFIDGMPLGPYEIIKGKENQKVLINAVETLCEQGISVGDLDSRNIVLTRTGKPYLVDFGYVLLHDSPITGEDKEKLLKKLEYSFFTSKKPPANALKYLSEDQLHPPLFV